MVVLFALVVLVVKRGWEKERVQNEDGCLLILTLSVCGSECHACEMFIELFWNTPRDGFFVSKMFF